MYSGWSHGINATEISEEFFQYPPSHQTMGKKLIFF